MIRSRYLPLALLVILGVFLLGALPSPSSEAVSAERIDRLIEQVGSGTFTEREKATKELDAIGVPALGALRKAARSDDAEVKRRAEELVKKIEKQAESAKVLAPKRLRLVCTDTPVSEAVAQLQKKSGYNLFLMPPEGERKEGKVTLDTGETTFWRALALLCEKADLVEATAQGVLMPAAPGAAPAVPGGRPLLINPPGVIPLKAGKSRKLPSDDGSAVRVRVLPRADVFGPVPPGESILALEVTPEPKLQWQGLQSVRIDKALDDRGQILTQITPQVPAGPPGVGGGVFAPGMMLWTGASQQVPLQLRKGDKAAKTLKLLKGVLSAQVLSEATPMIVADNLAKAIGKTFKGDEDGAIKIVRVRTDEQKRTIIELELRPFLNAIPAAPLMAVPAGAPVPPPGPALPPPPPPVPAAPRAPPAQAPAVPVQGRVRIGGPVGPGVPIIFVGPVNGLSVRDDKDKALPLQLGPLMVRRQELPGGGQSFTMIYTLICQPGKDQGEPAKVVYLGRKQVAVDIPFLLKDVPLR